MCTSNRCVNGKAYFIYGPVNIFYYMARPVSGQDEPNPAL